MKIVQVNKSVIRLFIHCNRVKQFKLMSAGEQVVGYFAQIPYVNNVSKLCKPNEHICQGELFYFTTDNGRL